MTHPFRLVEMFGADPFYRQSAHQSASGTTKPIPATLERFDDMAAQTRKRALMSHQTEA